MSKPGDCFLIKKGIGEDYILDLLKQLCKEIKKELKPIADDIAEVVNDSSKIKRDITEETTTAIYEDLYYIMDSCIDKFYESYTPKFYKREHSLYHAYKVKINDCIIGWDFSPSYMPDGYDHEHRATNEYIFQMAFVEGYHGGANTIAENKVEKWGKHPHDGQYWYRTAPPIFAKDEPPYSRWSGQSKHGYGAAVRKGMPPKTRIEDEINKYRSGKSRIVKGTPEDRYDEALELVYSRYRLFNYK